MTAAWFGFCVLQEQLPVLFKNLNKNISIMRELIFPLHLIPFIYFLCWVFIVQLFLLHFLATTKQKLQFMNPTKCEALFSIFKNHPVFLKLSLATISGQAKRSASWNQNFNFGFQLDPIVLKVSTYRKRRKKHLRPFCHNSNICNYLLFTAKTHFLQISNSANYSDASRLKVFNISCLKNERKADSMTVLPSSMSPVTTAWIYLLTL